MKLLMADILAKYRATFCFRSAAWIACISTVCCAGAMQANGTSPRASHHHTSPGHKDRAASSTQRANPQSAKTPLSPSPNASAQPATVTLKNGLLTVDANNSDLGQILKDVADISGMTVDGSLGSIRVFGVYGPGNSRDVLTDLLTGLGYNFMMVGVTQQGPPQKLELTLRSAGSTPVPSPLPTAAASDQHENPAANPSDQEPPGPGAVMTVPPEPQNQQDRVQQNLQRLQQMHMPQRPPQ